MSKNSILLILSIALLFSCGTQEHTSHQSEVKDFSQYVNPFIGTGKMGHTYPGATVPFGMVQLSPQSNIQAHQKQGRYNPKTYEYCAGYQYRDSTIYGFAHTNFSGTGHSDLGDFLLLPVTGDFYPDSMETADGKNGYYADFSHDNEFAQPGYYKVKLDNYDILAEMTASERVGFHKYTYAADEEAHFILDMKYNIYHHKNKNVWTSLRVENDSTITGCRQTKGWARDRKVFFAMQFSKPFHSYGHKKYDEVTYNGFYRKFKEEENFPEMAGKDLRAYFNFNVKKGDKIKVKMALSPVSSAGAMKNLRAEIPHWDFEQTRSEAHEKWNTELSKIKVHSSDTATMITFYTALYHSMLSPIIYEDVDGRYRGLDQNIHDSEGFRNHSIFSLWDTYRALHPLFNLLQPERNNEIIKSMLAHWEQSVHGMLPIWSHYANENWCMIGYHAVSLLADAMVKDVGDFDKRTALQAAIETANVPYYDQIDAYKKHGYIPWEEGSSSVSKTLEYAYDDWCIAQMAAVLEDEEIQKEYGLRAKSYSALFDPEIGFMRPKNAEGKFRDSFDPFDTHGQGFIEGNAWNYGLSVPHAVEEMIALMGGKEAFVEYLDSLFTMQLEEKYITRTEDVTRDGIIGNYVHGNEPSHHVPYLYNWTDKPWKTQERVRMIMDEMYGPTVEGLCGNDDAGQMSAWYLFSALGFYPVAPGSEYYALGSPAISEADIHFANGNTLHIIAENQSDENVYVQGVELNGIKINNNRIAHSELVKGGTLKFKMSNEHEK